MGSPDLPPAHRSVQLQTLPSDVKSVSGPQVAVHVATTFNDPIEHPFSPLSALTVNTTVPNRFRVEARVVSIHPRGMAGSVALVQHHCIKCRRQYVESTSCRIYQLIGSSFSSTYCQSCNDIDLNRAELRYRFIAILEQGDHTLPVIIADEDAAEFLPPLPPLSTSTNPNDHRKTQQRIKEASAQVLDVLLGARQDGERPRPLIHFAVETYEVRQKDKGAMKGVVVSRVFGMRCGPP